MRKGFEYFMLCLMISAGLVSCGGSGGSSGGSGSSATYSISGTITNNSSYQSSYIYIGACTDANMLNCPGGVRVNPAHSASYTIPDLPAGSYYVGGCADVNGVEGCTVPSDIGVMYVSNPVAASNSNITNINMTIQ